MTRKHASAAKRRVLIIGGPTASGKSGLALALAEKLSGTVINADSMQVYKALPLLTAQPSPADRQQVPHRLYAALEAEDSCSAARWRDMALAEIQAAEMPIIVGGTGFYLKTLMEGISPIPEVPEEYRGRAAARQKELGNPAFHAELAKRDPATAARLDPLNTQRLIRAWEVLEATGRPLADWQDQPKEGVPDVDFFTVTLLPPREALYAACDGRFDAMIQAGVLDEVRAFYDSRPGNVALTKALGYPELVAHLEGHLTLEEARNAAQTATRHYAKRQVTWFRHQVEASLTLESPDVAAVLARF